MRLTLQERLDRLRLRGAVGLIVSTAVVLAVVAAILELWIDPAFDSIGDALWFTVATVTTVGYGDIVPESEGGKIVASGLMLLGLGLIPVLTSVVVSILVGQRSRRDREAAEQEFRQMAELVQRLENHITRLEQGRAQ